MSFFPLSADGISVSVDLQTGHLAHLKVESFGRLLRPLHRAAWADDPLARFPEGMPPNVRHLSGDFFCAPFGRSDVDGSPSHGWPANSEWEPLGQGGIPGGVTASFRLLRQVMGATVEKTLTLMDGHPFVYQEHVLCGGTGRISAAHHTMVHMQDGGRLSFSPKQFARTLDAPLESDPARGRSVFAYPAQTDDIHALPMADSGTGDLTTFPVAERHEDFALLADTSGAALGWACVSRRAEQDLVFTLKDPAVLPVTMLWHSNGGRDYAPWSGAHKGVLGIEDGRADPGGHAASMGENALTAAGIVTAFDLGGTLFIRQVTGAAALPGGPHVITSIHAEPGFLAVRPEGGEVLRLPFDDGFLAGR